MPKFVFFVLALCVMSAHASAAVKWNNPGTNEEISTVLPDQQKRRVIKMAPSALDAITLPPKWPFETANKLLEQNRRRLSVELQDDFFLSKGQAGSCVRSAQAIASVAGLAHCMETLGLDFLSSLNTEKLQTVFLELSNGDLKTYRNNPNDFNPARYKTRAVITVYAAFYAFYYDRFNYAPASRKQVDDYFENMLLTLNMDDVGERKSQVFCDPRKQDNIGVKKHRRADINTCESNRWKATIAQLLLGMRLGNQTLFERGKYNTKFMLLAFDSEGIFVPWATRGALAIHYSNEVPRFLGKLTEIYYALGYDFLSHRLESGLTVKDIFDTYFTVIEDKTILDKYARRDYASKGDDYAAYRSRSTADELKRWHFTKPMFARESMRYISRFRPDLHSSVDCTYKPRQSDGEPQRLITSFSIIDSYEFYLSNFSPDQQNTEFCASIENEKVQQTANFDWSKDEFAGEYQVIWSVENVNKPGVWQEGARDRIQLKNGSGVFTYAADGFPGNKAQRQNLQIEYLGSSGDISISGELGLFEAERAYFTLFKGSLGSMELSTKWKEGDAIKVQLNRLN